MSNLGHRWRVGLLPTPSPVPYLGHMTAAPTGEEQGIPVWTYGDRMRKARERLGLSQNEMADLLGISRQSVSNYEQCHTRPLRSILRRWAAVTNVPPEWLALGDNPGPGGRANPRGLAYLFSPSVGISGFPRQRDPSPPGDRQPSGPLESHAA